MVVLEPLKLEKSEGLSIARLAPSSNPRRHPEKIGPVNLKRGVRNPANEAGARLALRDERFEVREHVHELQFSTRAIANFLFISPPLPIGVHLPHNITTNMSKSCDVLLDGKFTVHICIVPPLGLIMINELDDFADNWLEIKIVQNSKSRPCYEIRTLTGDGKQQAVCRYLIESLHTELYKGTRQMPEQVGTVLKFTINFNVRTEILTSRSHIVALGQALGRTLRSCIDQ